MLRKFSKSDVSDFMRFKVDVYFSASVLRHVYSGPLNSRNKFPRQKDFFFFFADCVASQFIIVDNEAKF